VIVCIANDALLSLLNVAESQMQRCCCFRSRRHEGGVMYLRCEAQVKSDHVDSEVHRKNGKSTCAV
jgi:hypothetical protein